MMATKIVNSALWAAYGDALGFITEMAGPKDVFRRIHADHVSMTHAWRRQVGGRFGAQVDLPPGCYSDDTQLRLATSRAIRDDGTFDVEAFAKVELPVWLSYALGAGRASKIAASELARQDVTWFSNFFVSEDVQYLTAGGNGAAMRIQPHVWAASTPRSSVKFLNALLKNAICTHGNARGILGAVFHGSCLALTLDRGSIPTPDDWIDVLETFSKAAAIIREDSDLSAFWVPVWEERVKRKLEDAFEEAAKELRQDISKLTRVLAEPPHVAYSQSLEILDAFNPSRRGTGTTTALLASVLSWSFRNEGPKAALIAAANALGSDTDTIATMAGAILGGLTDAPEPGDEILDREYIESEALRLAKISDGEPTTTFHYPDLMFWKPPKTQLDVVGKIDDGVGIAGLGPMEANGKTYTSRAKDVGMWQWSKLWFGQSILAKRRSALITLSAENRPGFAEHRERFDHSSLSRGQNQSKLELHSPSTVATITTSPVNREQKSKDHLMTIDEMTRQAIRSGFDPLLIGQHFLALAEFPDGIERAVSYAAIISKARMARVLGRARNPLEDR